MRQRLIPACLLAAAIAVGGGCAALRPPVRGGDGNLPQILAADPFLRDVAVHAQDAVSSGKAKGLLTSVGTADLVALALAFRTGSGPVRWGANSGGRVLSGATPVGPWAIQIDVARTLFGPTHGVSTSWSNEEVLTFLEANPGVQARIAADRLWAYYGVYGERGPVALQVFSAMPTSVSGTQSVDAEASAWRDVIGRLSPNDVTFADRVMLGTPDDPRGLLYLLARDGDEQGLREALVNWKNQRRYEWNVGEQRPRDIGGNMGMMIVPADVRPLREVDPRTFAVVNRLTGEVVAAPALVSP